MLLVEDSIVRGTTLQVLLSRIRQCGQPREIHVRVACPPIIAPCFYGIDMSTVSELFARSFPGAEERTVPFAGTPRTCCGQMGTSPSAR